MKSVAIYNDTDKTLKLIIQNLSAFNSKVVFYSEFAEGILVSWELQNEELKRKGRFKSNTLMNEQIGSATLKDYIITSRQIVEFKFLLASTTIQGLRNMTPFRNISNDSLFGKS